MCAFHRRSEVMVMPRYLACDTVSSSCSWSMYWVFMIVLFLVIGMTWHVSRLNLIFNFCCPFIKCVKIFLECSCVCLRLKSYIHYGVISKESNCRSNIVWNVVNVKKK